MREGVGQAEEEAEGEAALVGLKKRDVELHSVGEEDAVKQWLGLVERLPVRLKLGEPLGVEDTVGVAVPANLREGLEEELGLARAVAVVLREDEWQVLMVGDRVAQTVAEGDRVVVVLAVGLCVPERLLTTELVCVVDCE